MQKQRGTISGKGFPKSRGRRQEMRILCSFFGKNEKRLFPAGVGYASVRAGAVEAGGRSVFSTARASTKRKGDA